MTTKLASNQINGGVVKNFDTLAAMIADTGLLEGDTCYIKERTTGNGGASLKMHINGFISFLVD